MSPRWGSTPRLTDWLTVSRNVTLTLTLTIMMTHRLRCFRRTLVITLISYPANGDSLFLRHVDNIYQATRRHIQLSVIFRVTAVRTLRLTQEISGFRNYIYAQFISSLEVYQPWCIHFLFPSRMGYICEACLFLPNLITMTTWNNVDGLSLSSLLWGRYSRSVQSHLCHGIQTVRIWCGNFMHFRWEIQGLSFWAHTPRSVLNADVLTRLIFPHPNLCSLQISSSFSCAKTYVKLQKAWPRIPWWPVRSSSHLRKYYNIFSSKCPYNYRNS
jgi:hypothetical protein